MKCFPTRLRLGWAAMAACLLLTAPAAAQEPACNQSTWPANAPTGTVVDNYCENNSEKPCDLAIASWSLPTVKKSSDIRFGKAIDGSPEEPRFLFDSVGNRFYAKLYVKVTNSPGQGPAPASQVTVHLHYKEGDTPADPSVTTGWTAIGSYPMTIPAPAPVGALFPSQAHFQDQTRPVCWTLPAGDRNLPRKFTLRAKVEWLKGGVNQDDDTGNNTAYSFYDLTTQERKAQIAFAMDLSGSMKGVELTQAQQKAGMFTHLIEDGDGLGVYGFATHNPADNTPFTATYKVTPGGSDHTLTMHETREISAYQNITSLADRVTIAGRIAATTANGCTPVGQGLLRARAGLPATPPSDTQQAIVVFSDGLQNVHPYVNTAATGNCHPATPAAPMLDSALTFGGDGIKVYSIFWGPTSGYAHDLMQNIQTQTGSDVLYGTVTELGLASAYYSIRALVDDMLFLEESGVTSPGAPDRFTVVFDPTPEPATVSAAWNWDDGQTQLEIWCRKLPAQQFVPCVQLGQVDRPVEAYSGDSYTVFRFVPGPDTTWEFEVRQVEGSGPTEYAAAVFSPVQEAQIFPSLDNVGFETGKPLPIQAELRRAGAPVTGASVNAVVRAPARSFASTLRRFADRLNVPASGDDRAAKVVEQLQGLLRQEGSDEVYPVREISVPMTDNGDGTYSGVLPGKSTEIAGEYQVTITARLTLSSGRTVQRIAKLSALCNVGPPDPGKSLVKVLLPDPARDRSLAAVTVWPTDRFGNAAFPGSGSQISLVATGAKLVGSLRDNLVSGFTQHLDVIDSGGLPRVTVEARGVSLGTVYLVPRRARELSFHFGTAVPNGTFDVPYDQGPSIGVDYAWLLNSRFAVRVELVHDEFDVSAGGSEEMLNLSAYLRYRKTSGTWLPYFETGAGLYEFRGTTAVGYAGGLGLQRELTPRWNLDLNLQGHYVGGSLGISFSRLRVGAIYKF